MTSARFPIMVSYAKGAAAADPPLWIPWRIAELAYAAYSSRFGTDQTLERLAERGGFGAGEMDALLPGWRDMPAHNQTGHQVVPRHPGFPKQAK